MLEKIKESAAYVRGRIGQVPDVAVVLGSGLGYLAEFLGDKAEMPYGDIPHFPVSTAPDHAGKLVCGTLGGKRVLLMQGRIHYYEGYSMEEVVYPVRVLKMLGVKTLVVTNAVGAINTDYRVGDLMLICDHIKFFNDVPLRGKNIDAFGPRFNDMSDAYTKELRALVKQAAKEQNVPLHEGVYAYMPGPCFETPAEIRMLRTLGADVVGMSTVPEVITAAHAGMRVAGISFCTNMAAGITEKITELAYTDTSKERFRRLVAGLLEKL